jgi:uncharacterized membrane protein
MTNKAERTDKTIYELFEFSILLKAVGSIGEMVAGIFVAFVSDAFVLHLASLLTQGINDVDNDDFLARIAVDAAHLLAVSNNWLVGGYLFVRGLVQFLLVIALFKNKIWAYPAMLFVLLFLVVTQSYEIYRSGSVPTIIITIIDIATIYFVWREYLVVRTLSQSSR